MMDRTMPLDVIQLVQQLFQVGVVHLEARHLLLCVQLNAEMVKLLVLRFVMTEVQLLETVVVQLVLLKLDFLVMEQNQLLVCLSAVLVQQTLLKHAMMGRMMELDVLLDALELQLDIHVLELNLELLHAQLSVVMD